MDFNEKLIKYRVIEKKCRVNNFILGKNIIYLPFVDSTNNYLKNMNTAKSDVCIISDIQKTGRGRGRNSFVSPSGGLYLSFYLHNKINEIITNKTLICFVLANICVTVIKKYVKNAYLKWPNDIYINDKKVCGILIENIYHGNLLKKTIVGVGININTDFSCSNLNFCSIKEFYSLTKASSFQKKIDKDIDIPDFFFEIVKKFNDFYNGQILLSKNSKDDLFKSIIFEYKKNFYGINKNIKILDRINKNKANFSYYGVIKDIDFCGRLIIETKEGIKILSEEEISYFNF